MKLDLNRLLENKVATFRLAIFLILAIIYITPGLLLVSYYDKMLFIELSEIKLFAYSAAISLPFHILAVVLLLSPPSTQIEVLQDPSRFRGVVLSVGALFWAVIWVPLIYCVAILGSWTVPGFESLPEPYRLILAYLMCLAFFLMFGISGFVKVTVPFLKRVGDNK